MFLALALLLARIQYAISWVVSLTPVRRSHRFFFGLRGALEGGFAAGVVTYSESMVFAIAGAVVPFVLRVVVSEYVHYNHVIPRARVFFSMANEASRAVREVLGGLGGGAQIPRRSLTIVPWYDWTALALALGVVVFSEQPLPAAVKPEWLSACFGLAWFGSVGAVYLIAFAKQIPGDLFSEQGMPRAINLLGFIPWYLADAARRSKPIWIDFAALPERQARRGRGGARQIVALQLESVDEAAMLAHCAGEPVMPFLLGLARQHGYSRCTSLRGVGGTSDVEVAAINGFRPPVSTPLMMNENFNYASSIVPVLKSGGFRCFGVHNNISQFYKRGYAYRKMGFDGFVGREEMGLVEYGWGARDHDVLAWLDREIGQAQGPQLFYVITMSTHAPHTYVETYGVPLADFRSVQNPKLRAYFRSLRYLDESLGQVARGWLQRPDFALVLFGDHGAALRTPEFTSSGLPQPHIGGSVVPFIVAGSCAAGRQVRQTSSTLDVGPTILDLAGVPAVFRSEGTSLFEAEGLS